MTDLSEYVEKIKTVLQPVTPRDQKMYTLRNEGFKCGVREEGHEIRVRGTTYEEQETKYEGLIRI